LFLFLSEHRANEASATVKREWRGTDLDDDVRLVRPAGAPEHEQEEGEHGDERERAEREAPPRRLGEPAAAHQGRVVVVVVPDAAGAAAAVPEPAPGDAHHRRDVAAGAELVREEEPPRGGLPGVVHASSAARTARLAVVVVEVVVERRLGRGGPRDAAGGAAQVDLRVGGGGAEHVVGRAAARGPRRRGRRQARHVGVRLGVPGHLSREPRGGMRVGVGLRERSRGGEERGAWPLAQAQRVFDEGFKGLGAREGCSCFWDGSARFGPCASEMWACPCRYRTTWEVVDHSQIALDW